MKVFLIRETMYDEWTETMYSYTLETVFLSYRGASQYLLDREYEVYPVYLQKLVRDEKERFGVRAELTREVDNVHFEKDGKLMVILEGELKE